MLRLMLLIAVNQQQLFHSPDVRRDKVAPRTDASALVLVGTRAVRSLYLHHTCGYLYMVES